ncbi:MAG TPA: hypothetical protein VFP22_06535 [Candidatus Limnocylindrales bacterium]|nr:hypothetical protein [Candidatus Limnocylindrales bacterium]
MTTRGALVAALLAVVGRPSWWLLALAGFLARGGIVLFLLAIVMLPSPLALSNLVAPLLVPIVFGGLTPFLIAIIAIGILSLVAWVIVGAWLGAATEIVLIRDARHVAADAGVVVRPDRPGARWLIVRVTVAHLLAHVPLLLTIAVASVGIVNVTYVELVNPADVITPLPIRILREAAAPIAAIAVAWAIGELAGGVATRRIVAGGESILAGVVRGYVELVTRPRSVLLPAVTGLLVLAVDLAAMLAVVDLAWTASRSALASLGRDPAGVVVAIPGFAAAWCLALLVVGLVDAWRSVAVTIAAERVAVAEGGRVFDASLDGRTSDGTIGASTHRRPGDWSAGGSGGSL